MATWEKKSWLIARTSKQHGGINEIHNEVKENNQLYVLVNKQNGAPRLLFTKSQHHLQFFHYLTTKLGVAKCLYDKTTKICSNPEDRNEEFNDIKETPNKIYIPDRYLRLQKKPKPLQLSSNEPTETIISIILHVKKYIEKEAL